MNDATTIIKNMSPDEYKLRSMLCDAYSGAKAYRDDGEMSDSCSKTHQRSKKLAL